ncbi:condensation domain-containing protein [Amycolatopsis mediterranei]|uniref:non-ribosomal peptide synthetase n=1 Tax=Amycolatopsis mediterranei TaxID=33910 RepID=UPI0034354061
MTSAPFPLSPQQQLVWLHHELAPDSTAYNSTVVTDFAGPLDVAALRAAVAAVARNHPAFRLALATEHSGRTLQRVGDTAEPVVEEIDLSGTGATELDESLLSSLTGHPFDLAVAPLARWWLVRFSPRHHQLVHVESHLIHDGRSVGLFLTELLETYRRLCRGEAPALPSSVSYADYVEHCATPAFRSAVEADLAWWRERLAGADLGGPTFRGLAKRIGTRREFAGAQSRRQLPAGLCAALTRLAASAGCTVFAVVFGLFAELVRRHDGGSEVIVGTAVANRPPRFDRMIGMLVNSVPVRLRVDPKWTVRELAAAAMGELFDAVDHGAAPMQDIVRVTGHSSGTLDNPLFRAMVSMHDTALPAVDLPGLDVSFVEGVNLTGSRTADIDLVVLPGTRAVGGPADALTCVWDYSTEFFDERAVDLIAGRFERLLAAAAAAPERAVGLLPVTGWDDPPLVLTGPPAVSLTRAELVRRVRSHAGNSHRLALVSGNVSLSYRDLMAEVDRVAARLADAGLGEGDVVACVFDRDVSAVLVLLACLAGGQVFAPLPAAWTDRAVAEAVGRLAPAVVLTTPGRVRALSAAGVPAATVGAPRPLSGRRRFPGAAYLIHTSGSTGRPKRVVVPDEALCNAVTGAAAFLELTGEDRALQFAQPAFDVFFEEVLPTLHRGGRVVQPATPVPDAADLAALVAFRGLTVLNLPTAYAATVLPEVAAALAGRRHSLRVVVVGGERLPAATARRMVAGLPGARLVNAYGVTEAAITSTMTDFVPDTADAEVPLGMPLPGTVLLVLDERGEPAPIGMTGELAIGGPGASSSYVDEQSAVFGGVTGVPGRFFRTGDLGVIGRDGAARFLGRADRQLKVRGHRIEPEEIEAAARRLAGDRDVAVLPVMANGVVDHLVGYVETDDEALADNLNARLVTVLPRQLLVQRWLATPVFPRLANGKVDLAALRARPLPAPAARAGNEETDPAVGVVLECFRTLLHREDLDADADFFLHGGHSLLVANLITELRERTGVRLGMGEVFEAPTVRGVAALTAAKTRQRLRS